MVLFMTSSPDGDLGSDNGGSPYGFDNRNRFADRLRESLPGEVFFTLFASLNADNPNQVFPIGDGFGLFVYFGQAPGRYYSRKAKPKPFKATEKVVPKRRGRPPKNPRDPLVTE